MDNKKLTLNPSDSQKLQSTTAKSIDTTLDVTRFYLKEIGPTPLLSAEEEVLYARRYLNRGLSLLDLIEEDNLRLIHAVEKFDPEKDPRFSTYAMCWIR